MRRRHGARTTKVTRWSPDGLATEAFNKLTKWPAAVGSIGAPGLHFHDLRHTGNKLAASTRVSTRDLMARMGHDSMQAALMYQHATNDADRAVAEGLAAKMDGEQNTDDDELGDDDDGSAGALLPTG